INDASLPTVSELPESLSRLSRHQAFRLRSERFTSDAAHLVTTLRKILHPTAANAEVHTAGSIPEALSSAKLLASSVSSLSKDSKGIICAYRTRFAIVTLCVTLIIAITLAATYLFVPTQPKWCARP